MSFLSVLRCVASVNIHRVECPFCESATAKVNIMFDRNDKCLKFFLRCIECHTVTPAFEDIYNAFDNWDDLFVKQDLKKTKYLKSGGI